MVFGLLAGGYLLTRPVDGSSGQEIASEVGFNHVQKYQQIHGGAGTGMLTAAAGGWSSQVAKKFDEVNSLLAEANAKAGVAWQGQAAEAHGDSLKPMTTFVTDAKDVSTAVGSSTERQVENYTTVRNTMPEPKKVTATDSMLEKGGAWLFGTQTDLQQQEQEAMERAQEAQRLYGNYQASSSNETASLPYYPAAPKMTYSGDGYQGGGQVGVDGGGGYTGGNVSGGGGTYAGGGSGVSGNGSGVDWSTGGSGGASGGAGGGTTRGGGSDDGSAAGSGSSWAAPPATGGPAPVPGTGVGGGAGPGAGGGVIGGIGVGGGRGGSGAGRGSGYGRGGGGAGRGGTGAGRGGTGSGYGRGGSGYGAGRGGVGSGYGSGAGSGAGAGGRSGSGLGAGGRSGSGMPSTSSAYSSTTSGTTGARGGAMAGAGARGAQGEEDEEHENKYMVPTDEAWEDLGLPRTAPPVIGGDLEPPQR